MASALNCLPYIPKKRKPIQSTGPSSITRAPNLKWQAVKGPVQEMLPLEMKSMYWQGVKRELGQIILTMKKWQSPEYAATILRDEEDNFIHGFDTFVDQVSEKSRQFAQRYDVQVRSWNKGTKILYEQALKNLGKDIEASWESETLKAEIRDHLESMFVLYRMIGFTNDSRSKETYH